MYPLKIKKSLPTGLIIVACFFLWNTVPANAFPQNGSATGTAPENNRAGNIVMQAVSGTVVETMDSGGYTYAKVESEGTQTWVALPKSKIAVGNEITCEPGMVMNNFRSSTLNRTFEHIVFSKGLASSSAGTASAETAPPLEEPVDLPKVEDSKDWGDFFNKSNPDK